MTVVFIIEILTKGKLGSEILFIVFEFFHTLSKFEGNRSLLGVEKSGSNRVK